MIDLGIDCALLVDFWPVNITYSYVTGKSGSNEFPTYTLGKLTDLTIFSIVFWMTESNLRLHCTNIEKIQQ